MRQLEPIIVKPENYENLEKTISKFWIELFYKPILDIIKSQSDFLVNDNNIIKEALLKGTIQFVDGSFSGNFNSKITKELKRLGANFDKRTGRFNIKATKLPLDIQSMLTISRLKFEKMNNLVLGYVDNIDESIINFSIGELPLKKDYLDITSDLDKEFNKTTASLALNFKMKQNIAENLANNYSENMKLYIKSWTEENILKLREQVYKNTFEGFRAENLIKIIQDNYDVSLNKAKFLARQETSLLTSKFREERYTDAGINEYKWRMRGFHTREDHKLLNGKIFTWSNPPITNRKTGERNHPGEDYNCFCTAIPIVRF